MSTTRTQRRIPWLAILLVLPVLLLTDAGCDWLVPELPQEEAAAMQSHLEVYAAAARAFREDRGRWPEGREELFSVLRMTPRSPHATARIEALEDTGDLLRMPFVVERGQEPGAERPELVGVVKVAPTSAEDEPAARIHWEFMDRLRGRSGVVTMQECALGNYGADPGG